MADQSKRRGHKATIAMTQIPSGPPPAAPDLPNADTYLPQTRTWYETWTKAPQAHQFVATDWQRLHMLAPIVDAYFQEPKIQLLAEIRMNEQRFGATPEDRLRLRWQLDQNKTDDEDAQKKGQPARSRKDPRLTLVEGTG
jgi:hypothetical protein